MDMDRMTFAEQTAAMIVSVAQAANEGDQQAIAEHALTMAFEWPALGPDEDQQGEGPDYDYDAELADEAAAELAEIEES